MEIFEKSDSRETLFAELLLPVPIPKLFTYRVPFELNRYIKKGQRAIVQFGDRKILTGIVTTIHQQPPREYEAKYVLEILDEFPAVTDLQLKLFQWMADYYMCTLGEVMNAALPAGLKLSSESMVQLHPGFDLEESTLAFSEKEVLLIRRLQQDSMSYTDIAKFLGVKSIYSILKSLSGKNAIVLYEEVKEKFRPKTEKRIRLTASYTTEDSLQSIFEALASKPKQEEVLLKFLQEVPVLHDVSRNKIGISKKALLGDDLSESSLTTLIKNNVLEEFEQIIPRFGFDDEKEPPKILLSEEQERAQSEIFKSFEQHNITLLHGITGSGKTEIYINLIKKALESDAQVLYLLPEIALTTQIVQRLKKVFG
ncbi:MAG TPA: DEAD/DEAH box helicase, partial [Chryseosolibacter sp.]